VSEPRLFVSSTFYDLRHVRADLDTFIREMGYAPIRHEHGDIPYGREESLEEYCYREIERCDILLSIIGGTFGHESSTATDHSISQMELKVALRLRRQVYIFIEKNVYHEFQIFRSYPEADRGSFKPYHANDVRIHRFILEMASLPHNNPIFSFESAHDILDICRRQWAGLFQELLQQDARKPEEDLVSQLQETLSVLKQLVGYLTEEREQGGAVDRILLSNHPVFGQIQRLLDIPFRVIFGNMGELHALLADRGWRKVPEIEWQLPTLMEWTAAHDRGRSVLRVSKEVFEDSGQLKVIPPDEWRNEYVSFLQ